MSNETPSPEPLNIGEFRQKVLSSKLFKQAPSQTQEEIKNLFQNLSQDPEQNKEIQSQIIEILKQTRGLLNSTSTTTPEAQALSEVNENLTWDRERLIRWAEEELGKDEAWVDENFEIQPNGQIQTTGNLELIDCPAFETFPPNLTVNGDLWIQDCPALETLPDNLTVKDSLHIKNCPALRSIPPSIPDEKIEGLTPERIAELKAAHPTHTP